MVEEGQNQLKLIRFEETREDGEEDLISRLPDCSLVEILSRLPNTEYAIRTGALSKRWKHIWTLLLDLIFVRRDNPSADFFSSVDKILTQRGQLKLKRFMLLCHYNHQSEAQVRNWIHYAINCNVEKLRLWLWDWELHVEFLLDQCFFVNSCFTELDLSFCQLKPTGAISWKNLRSLFFFHVNLDEELIDNILSGCLVLESLVLKECYGYRRINITSKSVKRLGFFGHVVPGSFYLDAADVIEINAPNILSLDIQFEFYLWKVLLINVSALVEADLNYTKEGYYETTPKEAEEEMLKGFILNLRHAKKLEIGSCCLKVLSRLKAKGFILPSNLKLSGDLSEVSGDGSDDSASPERRDSDASDDSDSPEDDSDGNDDSDSPEDASDGSDDNDSSEDDNDSLEDDSDGSEESRDSDGSNSNSAESH